MNNGPIYHMVLEEQKFTYEEARRKCMEKGGFLPAPKNEQENNFMRSLSREDFWLGITDTFDEGKC